MQLHEKADQVRPLLRETGLDCWLIFVGETGLHPASAPDEDLARPLRPEEESEAARLFGWLAGEEAAAGPPVEALLGRLPPGMAQEIRRDLAASLAAESKPQGP